ncbi:hypothetical protein PoB_003821400 [Plakobranchus ocellatus]|uniref:Uncharacterized protein n=1 Tax=Plakobranchus ocellatus TaxID=259542 RepID=A0AAV4AZ97_9GAST|nr:hypothetical protein PoB_003821400 [Plakobranchus ocellatus]
MLPQDVSGGVISRKLIYIARVPSVCRQVYAHLQPNLPYGSTRPLERLPSVSGAYDSELPQRLLGLARRVKVSRHSRQVYADLQLDLPDVSAGPLERMPAVSGPSHTRVSQRLLGQSGRVTGTYA